MATPSSVTTENDSPSTVRNKPSGTVKNVLITGASSGIGEATARRLAAAGHRVFLGARRTERLERLAREICADGGTAVYRRLDVTDAEGADGMRAFVDASRTAFGRIDVLVNNAGVMPLSPLEAVRTDEWDRMIDVNVRGVLHGIAAALPLMREQGGGHVVNIASVGAYEVSPTAAVYCAGKFAVRAISEGLRQESAGDIRVTLVSPGVTESELADGISDPAAREAMRAYRSVALPASAIADAIAYAISQPPQVDVNEIVVRPAASAQ
ncbi:SDR family oxidoreductase [Streptomyces sp. NPDC047108]|uniref:SDR family oxidoreductase n=1 Tax=Streptomyces sp. NPDC047108 TaxID=3155025 RepID=UPI003401052E